MKPLGLQEVIDAETGKHVPVWKVPLLWSPIYGLIIYLWMLYEKSYQISILYNSFDKKLGDFDD